MSNSKVILFVLTMTTVVALLLSLMYSGLKDIHDRNEAIYNKKEIFQAVDPTANDMDADKIESIFDQSVKQYVLNYDGDVIEGERADKLKLDKEKKKDAKVRKYPLYVYQEGGKTLYIVTLRGSGLWDDIWGSFALKDDFRSLAGASFGHKGETPGLGAEIKDNASWKAQFKNNKKIFDDVKNQYLSVRKGGARDEIMEVDGIAGATITCDGVTDMIEDGLGPYFRHFEKLKNGKTGQLLNK